MTVRPIHLLFGVIKAEVHPENASRGHSSIQYIGADFVWQPPVTRAGVDGP